MKYFHRRYKFGKACLVINTSYFCNGIELTMSIINNNNEKYNEKYNERYTRVLITDKKLANKNKIVNEMKMRLK